MVRRISERKVKPPWCETAWERSCWRPKAWRSLLQVSGCCDAEYLESEAISVSTLLLDASQLSCLPLDTLLAPWDVTNDLLKT